MKVLRSERSFLDMKDNSEIESVEAELSEINLNLTKRFTSFDQLEKSLGKIEGLKQMYIIILLCIELYN